MTLEAGGGDTRGEATAIPNVLTLTFAQIDAIYRAGARRGSAEATAYEWGSSPSGGFYDELAEALYYDVIGSGALSWNDPKYISWEVIDGWIAIQADRLVRAAIQLAEGR